MDKNKEVFNQLVADNRSYRRFDETHRIEDTDLKDLVALARLTPSAANLQPLKYITCCHLDQNQEIFDTLKWAAYLKEWEGPVPGERPTGYIIMLHDQNIKKVLNFDQGIAAQSIMLGAVARGFGGCMIASFNQKKLRQILGLSANLDILLVLAIGKPVEIVEINPIIENEIKYWRDDKGVHHVPKRSLDEILVKEIK